jgi:hypothetical protein
MSDERKAAEAGFEQQIREEFPFEQMSAEEFAARNASEIVSFALDAYRYADVKLDAFMQRLGEVLRDWDLVTHYRKIYLTDEEMKYALVRDQE